MRKNGGVLERFLKSLLVAIFAAVVAFAPAYADTMCNLYNKADGVLYGYPTANITWYAGTGENSELTIRMRLTEGKTYTAIRAVAGGTPAFRIQASPTETLTNGQSLVNINSAGNTNTKTFVVPTGAPYVLFYVRNNYAGSNLVTKDEVINGFMLVEGSTAPAEYIPYKPLCATCDGTVVSYETVAAADVPAGVQNGTPSPTNPIEPVFYKQGDMVLRRIGDYADSYDATTGKITRRVGVKVLDGTEDWDYGTQTLAGYRFPRNLSFFGSTLPSPSVWYCTHYLTRNDSIYSTPGYATRFNGTSAQVMFSFAEEDLGITSSATDAQATAAFNTWLAQQYANGTPVTVYYPLATPVEENWPSSSCIPPIKIATTAYNSARFSPVVTELNDTIATIRDVVTNTINQTKAIADLQATKQTRPDSECPAGKKCLLVEDVNGVPHWYEIIEEYIPPE